MILGDNLTVMHSLARREDLTGKVQMIYIDPPYGIKFGSNFQPEVGKRDVKDKESDLTREPEQVKAYRDTWTLGVHSYLAYLRDRLVVAKELLADSGSIFVQISDENLHSVRMVMDEIFGTKNFCAVICFSKTGGLGSKLLYGVFDFILWYSKDLNQVEYFQIYEEKLLGNEATSKYENIILCDGTIRPLREYEAHDPQRLPDGARVFRLDNLTSQGNAIVEYEFHNQVYKGGWKTNAEGMKRLDQAERIIASKNSLNYLRFLVTLKHTHLQLIGLQVEFKAALTLKYLWSKQQQLLSNAVC